MNESIPSQDAAACGRPVRVPLGIAAVVVFLYVFVFPLTVIAADACGFPVQKQTRAGKVITAPLAGLARIAPPYKAYLNGAKRVIEFVFAAS